MFNFKYNFFFAESRKKLSISRCMYRSVYLIDKRGCRNLGVNPTKTSSVNDLYINSSSIRQKKLSPAVKKIC